MILRSSRTLVSFSPLSSSLALAFCTLVWSLLPGSFLNVFVPFDRLTVFVPFDRPLVACLPFSRFPWHATVMAFLSPALVVVVANRAPPVLETIPLAFFFLRGAFPLPFAFAFLSQSCPCRDHGVPVFPAPTARGNHAAVVPVVAAWAGPFAAINSVADWLSSFFASFATLRCFASFAATRSSIQITSTAHNVHRHCMYDGRLAVLARSRCWLC